MVDKEMYEQCKAENEKLLEKTDKQIEEITEIVQDEFERSMLYFKLKDLVRTGRIIGLNDLCIADYRNKQK